MSATTVPRCPLTYSTKVELLQRIASLDVIKLYRRIGLDVSSEFEGIAEFGFYYAPHSCVKFFYPAVCGSALFYQQLQLKGNYYEEHKFEFALAADFIKPFARVLEVGCGDGAFAKFLSSKHPDYLGIETNPAAVVAAQAAGINVENIMLEQMVERQYSAFDVVCAFQVLEHVADAKAFLEKMLALLSANGYLILSVPNDDGFIGKTLNHIYNVPPHHVTRWNEAALRHIGYQFKLKVCAVAFEPLPHVHWQWYREAMFFDRLRARFAPSYRCAVDLRFSTRLIVKFSNFLSAMNQKELAAEPLLGHTLVIVFQK
ncbi:MAG: hypothetical protein CMR00_06975 [[Chlorobium] sp. 445]|nr:MAG: hypothetical protein CMR00_06975 [[Chlorobium] sp. 445]